MKTIPDLLEALISVAVLEALIKIPENLAGTPGQPSGQNQTAKRVGTRERKEKAVQQKSIAGLTHQGLDFICSFNLFICTLMNLYDSGDMSRFDPN